MVSISGLPSFAPSSSPLPISRSIPKAILLSLTDFGNPGIEASVIKFTVNEINVHVRGGEAEIQIVGRQNNPSRVRREVALKAEIVDAATGLEIFSRKIKDPRFGQEADVSFNAQFSMPTPKLIRPVVLRVAFVNEENKSTATFESRPLIMAPGWRQVNC